MKVITVLLALILGLSGIYPAVSHAAPKFNDVDPKKYGWAMNSISFMVDKGVVSGYPDGRFQPDRLVDKAEMTVMIYRLFDQYRPYKAKQKTDYSDYHIKQFVDVPKNHWAYTEITSIVTQDWWNAVNDSPAGAKFFPDTKLNRIGTANMLPVFMLDNQDIPAAEVFQILSAMRDIPIVLSPYSLDPNSPEDTFQEDGRYNEDGADKTNILYPLLFGHDDNEILFTDDYSGIIGTNLALLQKTGIMTAWNGKFEGGEMLTRAEAVTILHRFYNYLKQTGTLRQYSSK
ncbi:S-layer homology domain-containing protein [Brevibacillus sp. HB1.4B]|uniref:S-layer homology domain-containing protein n=1 Tax=Brevibacillus sp. HB1.4B TaxID=2738845 RepID=UPI0008534005|nr:S-layer homology domain-containing protein [Brevibacillus sp. HB1.4B]NRS20087.1 S-layer homology domain-containing protein [Brevibacillus sp. HB1.4B]